MQHLIHHENRVHLAARNSISKPIYVCFQSFRQRSIDNFYHESFADDKTLTKAYAAPIIKEGWSPVLKQQHPFHWKSIFSRPEDHFSNNAITSPTQKKDDQRKRCSNYW
uniref:Uncharacterized protein n=1 Tax=Caenorhabditis japonica TaxID=281687 RepID=A0A8R1ETT0_CAEJA